MNGIRIVAAVVIGGTVAAAGPWLSSTGLYVLLSPELSGEADRLAAALHLQEGRVVADVGAGRGRLSEALAHPGWVGRQGLCDRAPGRVVRAPSGAFPLE